MKISSINKQTFWPSLTKVETKGKKSFSNLLDMAHQDNTRQQLLQMLNKIKEIGNKLKVQVTEPVIAEYKQLIAEYLSYVLKNFYVLRKHRSLDYSTLYTRIEIIDKEVDELTKKLLNDQKENIDIVASLDKIIGLLIDIYQ
ncbi:MAG: YaaR family protein [Desulfotomaculum sp.]|nr:YaaR family protein [Desulfotomaculum sp.]